MKLWGGRFTKETDKLVNDFNASIGFDKRLYKQDIEGSIAHATMLGDCNIIPKEDSELIVSELKNILADIEAGKLVIDDEYEDIHTFVEATLITRIGDVGKKLHTGRSRNDQVALDMRLYTRSMIEHTNILLKELLEAILKVMKENIDTFMPGFTHLQKAQPITLAHHLGAYFEMFVRDRSRLEDNYKRMNYCPLGAGALAGTTYPLDRDQTAKLLGFEGPTRNSLDSVSDRDYLIEYLSDLSIIMMHLSRLSEEICIWNSNEYGFTEIDDAYSTGSSIMPQKKNPDIAELVRGKTGRVYGAYLVKHGMPFRDAHRVIGEMVLFCLDRNISLLDLTLEEFKNFSEIFDEDIYDAISLETCVDARLTKGAPGPARMKEAIAEYEKYLAE